jgi:hypothetical protein
MESGCVQGGVFKDHIFAWFEDEFLSHVWAALDCVIMGFTGGADVLDVRAFGSFTVDAAHVSHGVAISVGRVVTFSALIGGILV